MKKRKAINFDLSTSELKKHFGNTAEAYNQIKSFMIENDFEHRQYSGYVSKDTLNDKQVSKMVEKLAEQFSWLSTCVQHFDVTDIGEQHDLTHLFISKIKDKNLAEQISPSKQDIPADSKAIESLKQKIAGLEKSGKLDEIVRKKGKGKDFER